MNFQRERIHDVIDEVAPLLVCHFVEISHDPDIALDPDFHTYKKIEENGALRVFTARDDDGTLVGYNCFFVNPNLHYQSSLQAVQDVLYVDKERRGFGRTFIKWCDDELRKEGVQKVYHHLKAKYNFGPMLERMGYELVDLIYAKRLDKELS